MCVAFAPKYRITELAQKINISPLGAMVVSTLQYGGNWVSMLLPLHLYKKSNALHDYIMSVYAINTSPFAQKRTLHVPGECTNPEVIKTVIKIFSK